MLDALPLAVQQLTLRFVDLERERFTNQARLAEEIISNLRGPYVKELIGLRQRPVEYPVESSSEALKGKVSTAEQPEGMQQDMLLTSDGTEIFFDNVYARLLCAPTENVFSQKHAPLFQKHNEETPSVAAPVVAAAAAAAADAAAD